MGEREGWIDADGEEGWTGSLTGNVWEDTDYSDSDSLLIRSYISIVSSES